ncbi:MAG TPA: hypothetical protein VNJ01_00925 [Bacteriovoracaceae bacterium]|nr:hypothetical protein [Bacteriovoracaceae bacterium]
MFRLLLLALFLFLTFTALTSRAAVSDGSLSPSSETARLSWPST